MKSLQEIRAEKAAAYKKETDKLERISNTNQAMGANFIRSRTEAKIRNMELDTNLPILIRYCDATIIKGIDGCEDIVLPDTRLCYYLADLDALAHPSFNCTGNECHLPKNGLDLSYIPFFKKLTREKAAHELRTLIDKFLCEQKPQTWEELKNLIADHFIHKQSF